MRNEKHKVEKRVRRHKRIRAKIKGSKARPRLAVFKSNKYIYAQLIDDRTGRTLAAAMGDKTKPREVGGKIAAAGAAAKIKKVVFDRGGFLYAGKIKLLAEGAREGGLQF